MGLDSYRGEGHLAAAYTQWACELPLGLASELRMQTSVEEGRRPNGESEGRDAGCAALTSAMLLEAQVLWEAWSSMALLPWLAFWSLAAPGVRLESAPSAAGTPVDANLEALSGPAPSDTPRGRVSVPSGASGNIVYVNFRSPLRH